MVLLMTHKNTQASKYEIIFKYVIFSIDARPFQKHRSWKVLCVLMWAHILVENHQWAVADFKVFPLYPLFLLLLAQILTGMYSTLNFWYISYPSGIIWLDAYK